jgi:hypothetical protein
MEKSNGDLVEKPKNKKQIKKKVRVSSSEKQVCLISLIIK